MTKLDNSGASKTCGLRDDYTLHDSLAMTFQCNTSILYDIFMVVNEKFINVFDKFPQNRMPRDSGKLAVELLCAGAVHIRQLWRLDGDCHINSYICAIGLLLVAMLAPLSGDIGADSQFSCLHPHRLFRLSLSR